MAPILYVSIKEILEWHSGYYFSLNLFNLACYLVASDACIVEG